MPPACPVEIHACSYKSIYDELQGCHRLVRWRFTLAATKRHDDENRDATGLSGGDSRLQLRRPNKNPHGCHRLVRWRFTLAATMTTNSGMPGGIICTAIIRCDSRQREAPPGKPVASSHFRHRLG